MSFFKGLEDHGHNVIVDLEDHLAEFHKGLDALEERLLHRRGVVNNRLSELESEHQEISKGLELVKDQRK